MLKLTYSILPISDVYVLAKTRDVTPLIFRVHIYFISAGSPELILWEDSIVFIIKELTAFSYRWFCSLHKKYSKEPSGKILMYATFSIKI